MPSETAEKEDGNESSAPEAQRAKLEPPSKETNPKAKNPGWGGARKNAGRKGKDYRPPAPKNAQGGTILMDPRCPIWPGIPMGERLLSVFGRHPESAAYAVLRHNGCVCSEPIVDSRCLSVLCAILNRPQYHTKTCRNWDYVKGSDVAKQLPEALKAFEEANPAQAHFDEAIKAQLIDDGANAGLSRAAAREKEARRKLWRICHTRQWTGLFNSPEGTVRMQRYTSAGMPEFDTVVTCLDKGKLVPAHLWKCKTELSMACMYS